MSVKSSGAASSHASLLSGLASSSDPSDVWGNASFRGCRMCRRGRNSPNPFDVEGKPFLSFKSERHHLCLPCCGVVRKKDPELLGSVEKRNQYIKALAESEERYNEHMSDLAAYEQQQIQFQNKRKKSGSKCTNAPELSEPATEINVSQETGLEMRKMLGGLPKLS